MGPRIFCGIICALLAAYSALGVPTKVKEEETPTEAGNSILEDLIEVATPARLSNLLHHVSNLNDIPTGERYFNAPYQVIDKASLFLQKNGYDPYFLEDLLIPGPSVSLFRNARCSQVLLQDGRLFGMSDIRSVDGSMMSDDPSQLWLIWKNMRVTFKVTVDIEGLKDFGDLDVKVGRLMMHVQSPSAFSDGPKLETSRIRRLQSELSGLQMTSEDVKRAICQEVESKLKSILNGKVRYILLNNVKRTINEDSSDNELMPLQMAAKFYDVHF